jgi:hypothetical protein
MPLPGTIRYALVELLASDLSIRVPGRFGDRSTQQLEVQCSTSEQHLLHCAVDRRLLQDTVCA